MRYYRQKTEFTCGPAVIRMILAQKNIYRSEESLAKEMKTSPKTGTSQRAMVRLLQHHGYRARAEKKKSVRDLYRYTKKGALVIVDYYLKKEKEGHYALLREIKGTKVYLIDPWNGKNTHWSKDYFKKIWHDSHKVKGRCIVVEKSQSSKTMPRLPTLTTRVPSRT